MPIRTRKYHISFRFILDISIIAVLATALLYALFRFDLGGHRYLETERLWKYFIWQDEDGTLRTGLLLKGLFTTLRLGFWAMLLAWPLGLISGFMRRSSSVFFRLVSGTYVNTIRNIPPLVVVFVIYFFLGMILSRHIPWGSLSFALKEIPFLWVLLPLEENLDFFFSAVMALGLYEGAYTTEIVRAGLESVPRGQWEAASSLGLSRRTMLFSVIFPQALRLMLPPLVSQSVSLIKDSSIVSAISVAELTFQGREIMNTTYMVFELWVSVTLMYLCVSLGISACGHCLERGMRWKSF